MSDPLPPDIAAWITQATINLMALDGYEAPNERAVIDYMRANTKRIVDLARERMEALYTLLMEDSEISKAIKHELCVAIYGAIRKEWSGKSVFNDRFLDYAKERGLAPEDVMKAEGTMAGYLTWRGPRRGRRRLKVTDDVIDGVRHLYHETDCSMQRVASHFNLSPSTVNNIINKKGPYADLPQKTSFPNTDNATT